MNTSNIYQPVTACQALSVRLMMPCLATPPCLPRNLSPQNHAREHGGDAHAHTQTPTPTPTYTYTHTHTDLPGKTSITQAYTQAHTALLYFWQRVYSINRD